MANWPVDTSREQLYVAGMGLGTCRGRTADGAYLMDFEQLDYVVACVPSIVFEIDAAAHPACAFAIEGGHA